MTFEVQAFVDRADALLERAPRLALRQARRHLRARSPTVQLPGLDELPLRPLFLPRAFVDQLVAACAPGAPLPAIALPSGVPGADGVVITEPPHGRDWLLHLAYVEVAGVPLASQLGVAAPALLAPLADFFGPRLHGRPLGLVLDPGDEEALEQSHVRVLQLLWHLESVFAARGVHVQQLTGATLDAYGGFVQWMSPSPLETDRPVWPARPEGFFDRRRVASFAAAPGSRYAPVIPWGAQAVFKPFDDPHGTLETVPEDEDGVIQQRVARPRVRLPFARKNVVEWLDCEVEVTAFALEGRVIGAFATCAKPTKDGPFELVCPAVVVP